MSAVTGTYGTMYYVRDMAKAVEYYREQLGLKPTFESPDWTEFSVNGHALCLHIARQDSSCPGVLILKVKGLEALVSRMKSKGVEFTGPIKEVHPGAYSADFRDPDGNTISLYENRGE